MSKELARLRGKLELLKKECLEIGRIPPRPPGLRAAVGAAGVAMMQRLMFWYTPALERTIGGVIGVLEDTLNLLDREMPGAFDRGISPDAGPVERQLYEQGRALEQERITTIGLESSLREQIEALQQFEDQQQRKEADLGRRLDASDERFALLRREVLDLARQATPQVQGPKSVAPPGLPAEYPALQAALENEIRGARAEALARRRVYLPFIPRDAPVLDLNCGRGEWLELLHKEGIAARGVESNRLLAAECREGQLDVEQGEPLEYLAQAADGSLGAVTALRLVEYLALPDLVRLLDEVARVLRPGGTAIFETPNPENILVASRDFYRDPARRRPIPAEALRFLAESRGFASIQVLLLNPAQESERLLEDGESAVTHRFNRYFYGPRDYAVVGRKV